MSERPGPCPFCASGWATVEYLPEVDKFRVTRGYVTREMLDAAKALHETPTSEDHA